MSFAVLAAADGGTFEVEFVPNVQNLVTTIWIRNSVPGAVRVRISHPDSGYNLDSEFVLSAPISINVPNPRRFPDDQTATVEVSRDIKSVP